MRCLMSVALAISSLVSIAQDSQTLVDFRSEARPLKVVLEEVSKKTGVQMSAGELGRLPIIVVADKMPLDEFLKDVAKATDANWEQQSGQYVLVRGRGKENAAIKQEAKVRGQRLETSIKTHLKTNSDTDWSSENIKKRLDEDRKMRESVAKQSSLQGESVITHMSSGDTSPSHMFLNEAISKISPEVLGSILPGQRVVFSSQPTRAQVRLPYQSSKVRDFIEANNRLADLALAESGSTNVGGVNVSTDLTKQRSKIQGIAKLLIGVTAFSEGISLQAFVVGPNGEVYDQPSTFVMFDPLKSTQGPDDAQGEIKLFEENYELVRSLIPSSTTNMFTMVLRVSDDELASEISPQTDPATLSAGLRTKLSDIEKVDPLSLFPSDALLQLADSRKKNLVACLPDRSFLAMSRAFSTGKMQVKTFYQSTNSMKITIEEGNSIVIRPLNQAESDRTRINRASLAKLIGIDQKQGWLSIKDILGYAATMPDMESENLDAVLINLLMPAYTSAFSQNPQLLKLYASTYSKLNQPNVNPTALNARFATSLEKNLLETYLYRAQGMQVVGNGSILMTATSVSSRRPQAPSIFDIEATEAYPDGIPEGTSINLNRVFGEGVLAVDDKGNSRIMSATDLGMHQGFDWSTMNPQAKAKNYEKFKAAEVSDHNFRVDFGRKKGDMRLRDAFVRGGVAGNFASLPDSIKEKVAKGKETTSRMKFGTVVGSPIGRTPPPK